MPNKFEEIKNAKHPLDSYPDILRYAAMGPEGWRAITDDDKERLKWFGVFFRKPTPGHFMMRVRIPNGIATADQVREMPVAIEDVTRRHPERSRNPSPDGAADQRRRQVQHDRLTRLDALPRCCRVDPIGPYIHGGPSNACRDH